MNFPQICYECLNPLDDDGLCNMPRCRLFRRDQMPRNFKEGLPDSLAASPISIKQNLYHCALN